MGQTYAAFGRKRTEFLAERAFGPVWHSSAEGGATAPDGSFGSQSSFAPTSASFPRSVGWSGPLALAAVLPRP